MDEIFAQVYGGKPASAINDAIDKDLTDIIRVPVGRGERN